MKHGLHLQYRLCLHPFWVVMLSIFHLPSQSFSPSFSTLLWAQEARQWATSSSSPALWFPVGFGHWSTSAGDQRKRGNYIQGICPQDASLLCLHGLLSDNAFHTAFIFTLHFFLQVLVTILTHFPFRPSLFLAPEQHPISLGFPDQVFVNSPFLKFSSKGTMHVPFDLCNNPDKNRVL